MPDISKYLLQIENAVYGEEVRGSIHDAIEAINKIVDISVDNNRMEYHEVPEWADRFSRIPDPGFYVIPNIKSMYDCPSQIINDTKGTLLVLTTKDSDDEQKDAPIQILFASGTFTDPGSMYYRTSIIVLPAGTLMWNSWVKIATSQDVISLTSKINKKQDKLVGEVGQVVTFDKDGNPVAVSLTQMIEDKYFWSHVQEMVRLGLGPKLFPVGYEFTVYNSDYDYDMIWRVVAHDHHKVANKAYEHTMTLEMKHVLSNSSGTVVAVQFSAPQAIYYAKDGLEAGTYNFSYDSTSIHEGTYQFTITKSVPAGGQIAFGNEYNSGNIPTRKLCTYASAKITIAIEKDIAIINGSDGANIGAISLTAPVPTNMNQSQRVTNGSNNYGQSDVDQFLNSAAAAGSVWEPQTIFDRPPLWMNILNGFIHGLPEDFLKVVQPAIIPCCTNSMFETDGIDSSEFAINQTYELTRKFFSLSRPEVFGSYDRSDIKDGTILEYYDGLTNTERIHRDNSDIARNTCLRSPTASNASGSRYINADGEVAGSNATNGYGIAAACIIA